MILNFLCLLAIILWIVRARRQGKLRINLGWITLKWIELSCNINISLDKLVVCRSFWLNTWTSDTQKQQQQNNNTIETRANGRSFVGQQLQTLLDVTCWVRLHTMLHIVACCCVLLRVVVQSLKPVKLLLGQQCWELLRPSALSCTFEKDKHFFFSVYVFFMTGFWALKRETWPRPLTFLWPVNTTGSSPRFILSPAFTTREERLIVGRLGSWMCCLCFISANGWTFSDKDENRLTVFLLLFDLCRT